MSARPGCRLAAWVLTVLLVAPATTYGQSVPLDRRIGSAAPGAASFEVALREGVEVCDRGNVRVHSNDRTRVVSGSYVSGESDGGCVRGVAHVRVEQDSEGRVTDLDLVPGPASGTASALGPVGASEAGEYLFGVATRDAARAPRGVVQSALMITTVLDDFDPAPGLLTIASDRAGAREARTAALFWVSQVASGRVGTHLAGIAAHEAEDQEVRDAAVFALSQRPADEAVPALADLARTAPHVKTRRSALFWLAQTDDPRVAELFAELILRGPLGGG